MKNLCRRNFRTFSKLLLPVLLFIACNSDELIEPAVYTPGQMRFLLTADSSKLWELVRGPFLEEDCQTGYLLRFQENSGSDLKQPFQAFFYRNTALSSCSTAPDTVHLKNYYELIEKDTFLQEYVRVLSIPTYKTTDTLMFVGLEVDSIWFEGPEGDSALYISPQPDTTLRLVKLLTSQRLLMEVLGPDKQVLQQEEYRLVEEPFE